MFANVISTGHSINLTGHSRAFNKSHRAFTGIPGHSLVGPDERDESHAKKMLASVHKCYEEGKFCDVTLAVADSEIKTHRLVLNFLSSYFINCFEYNEEDIKQLRFEITQFNEATMKCILHFAYTGELQVDPSNVLRVIVACDFLQLDEMSFIRKSVISYLKENIDEANCPAMLAITEQFDGAFGGEMKDILIKYASRNFARVGLSDDFIELVSDELLVEILKSVSLVVDLGRDFLPTATEQENFILDIVLLYVSRRCENEQQADLLLSKLIHYIRCHHLSPLSLQKLEDAGGTATATLVRQAKGEIEAEDDVLIQLWGSKREGTLLNERCYKQHAHRVHVGPRLSEFGDEPFTNDPSLFIKGMKVWIRLWDNRPVIGGLKLFFYNGESPVYGGDDEKNSDYEFHLDDGERIVKAEVRSGWMVDSLMFYTNKGKELGPYGGDGGSISTEQPRGEYGFLSYLKGAVVLSQQKLAISHLQLIWKEYLVDPADLNLDSGGSDDEDLEIVQDSSSESSVYNSE